MDTAPAEEMYKHHKNQSTACRENNSVSPSSFHTYIVKSFRSPSEDTAVIAVAAIKRIELERAQG
jgi:hypothetical protein